MPKFLFLFSIGISLVAAVYWCRVQHIACYTSESSCPTEVTEALLSLRGSSLLFSNFENKATLALAHSPYTIGQVTKIFPQTLELRVQKNAGAYELYGDETSIIIDEFAQVQTETPQTPNYRIRTESETLARIISAGRMPMEIHQQLQRFLTTVESEHLSVTNLQLHDDELQFTYADKTVLLPLTAADKITAFLLISKKIDFAQFPTPISEIDLRYKLAVLR